MGLSNRTLALLARPFEGGDAPSHSAIELVWTTADAEDYLPAEGNKFERVLAGLRTLQRGGAPAGTWVAPDAERLRRVAGDLSLRLVTGNFVEAEALDAAFAQDGFALDDDELSVTRPTDEPTERLAAHVLALFGRDPDLDIARNHYEQANRAFERSDWEAANAQYRSACDAACDALAHRHGCPAARTGGRARQWLQAEGLLETDEADLLRTFMAFAGRAGSHAGLSGAGDAQLRRHFATALIAFAVAKLGMR